MSKPIVVIQETADDVARLTVVNRDGTIWLQFGWFKQSEMDVQKTRLQQLRRCRLSGRVEIAGDLGHRTF